MTNPPTLRRGDRFRGLEIHRVLGRGSTGIAYLASHTNLKIPVVIKLFRITMRDPLAEAHLAARVMSASVVPVLDAGEENGVPFVMQRFVDGIDLEELLQIHLNANRAIPIRALIRLGVDIHRGLAAIHTAGVIHRDIKPANLFLAGSGRALVGDFGIAVDPQKAHSGEIAGTPMFLAPEVWSGQPPTARGDLYSAAATLYMLWQRHALLESESDGFEIPQTDSPADVQFGAVLAKSLSQDAADRPESALATARMLERIVEPAPELRGHEGGVARVGDVTIAIEVRDLATSDTDVIVAGAREDLAMRGGGSADAIRIAAGDAVEAAAMAQAPVAMGQVVWTPSGTLACKEIAHAVAAMNGAICVQRTVLRTLFEAERRGYRSITFPALGTGIGGVPHGLGAQLVLEAIRTFAAFEPAHLRAARIALAKPEAEAPWMQALIALDAEVA